VYWDTYGSIPPLRGAARVVAGALARAAAAAARAATARENEQSAAQSPCGRMVRGNRLLQRLE